MSRFETWLKTDLMQPNQVVPLHGRLFTQDAMSNLIGVHVFSDGEPVDSLTGSVIGWIIRADGTTVVVTGEKEGSGAYIVLPEAAYAVVGNITITIRLVDESGEDEVKTTLGVCTGYVYRTTTDTIIDPGEVVPDLATLLAEIEAMEEATAAAQEAVEDVEEALQNIPQLDRSLSLSDAAAPADMVGEIKNATTLFDSTERGSFVSGYYPINAVGGDAVSSTPSSSSSMYCCQFECSAGDVFQATILGSGTNTGGARAYAFLDSNRVVLVRADKAQRLTDEILIAPANSAYLVINSTSTTSVPGRYVVRGNKLSYLVNDIPILNVDMGYAVKNIGTVPSGITSADDLGDNTIVFVSVVSSVPTITGCPYAPCWVETVNASSTIKLQVVYPYDEFSTNKPQFRVMSSGVWGDWQDWGKVSTYTYTLETSNDTYNNTYNITTSPNFTTDENGWLNAVDSDTADETSKTDMTGAIMSLLNDTGYCHLGSGIFYVSGNIDMPRYATLEGCGDSTIIRLLQTVTSGYAVRVCQNNLVSGIRFSGGRSDLDYTSSTIGGRYGIAYLGNSDGEGSVDYPLATSCNVRSCSFENFSGAGIYCNNTGGAMYQALKVEQCYIRRCIVGININYYSEYHKFIDVVTYRCHWACINNGGNNVFVGCTFGGVNGFMIDNSQSDKRNNGHGSIIGCIFNHIDEKAIHLINCTNGFIFDGCQNFYGDIYVINCKGVLFSNMLLGGTSEYPPEIHQTGLTYPIYFMDCIFNASPTIDSENVKCVNCFMDDGTAVTAD